MARRGGIAEGERYKYLRFVLAKSGFDSTTLVARLAAWLKVDVKRFTFAGLKDKSGVTEQEVCAVGVSPGRLLRANQVRVHTSLVAYRLSLITCQAGEVTLITRDL